jgi:hypothetical protein
MVVGFAEVIERENTLVAEVRNAPKVPLPNPPLSI